MNRGSERTVPGPGFGQTDGGCVVCWLGWRAASAGKSFQFKKDV